MNNAQFVTEYRTKIVEMDAHFVDLIDSTDEDDEGFSAPNLAKFLDANQGMLEALTDFRMSGANLAEIVEAIGGAEMYEFSQIPLLEDIRTLRSWLIPRYGAEPIAQIEDAEIEVALIRQWMKERGIDEVEVNRFAGFWVGTEYNHEVTVDQALGGIIHARQIATLQNYNHKLAGGDDTYFDYYPGEMFYSMAVMNWFLNDGPRMV